MLRQFVIGLGACAAVCLVAGSASADEINLHCSDGFDYRIDLNDAAGNGENRQLQIDRTDLQSPKSLRILIPTPASGKDAALRLDWRIPHYTLDLSKGRLDVIFNNGRRFEMSRLRCTNLSRKLAV